MKDYGEEMRKDYERGWAKFQRGEKRREALRMAFHRVCRIVGYAIGVAFMAALSAVIWICALFPDYECERIFRAVGRMLWAR